MLGVALAFGLAIVAMAYGIGPVSGCHVNPAVSFGAFIAGRMSAGDLITYVVAQCLGAIVGAAVLPLTTSPNYCRFAAGRDAQGAPRLARDNIR